MATTSTGQLSGSLVCQSDLHIVSTVAQTPVAIDILSLVVSLGSDQDTVDLASLAVISGPLFGSATVVVSMGEEDGDPESRIIYVARPGFTGVDVFVYSICDKAVPAFCCGDPFATVAIYVSTPVTSSTTISGTSAVSSSTTSSGSENIALTCQNDIYSVSTISNTQVSIDVLALVTDVEGDLDTTSLTLTSGPLFGSAVLDTIDGNATITYIPAQDFTGVDVFVYSICDSGIPPYCCRDSSATVAIYVTGSTSSDTTGKFYPM